MSKEKDKKSTEPIESVQDTIVDVAKEETKGDDPIIEPTKETIDESIQETDTTQDGFVDPAKEETTTNKPIVESTKKSKKREEIAIQVFFKNSDLETIYFTSDLIPFRSQTDALRHTESLNDKIVVTINKSDLQ